MTPTVSVIVAARDAADTLGQQLDALAGQTLAAPWELIVVDDASTDGTVTMAERWSGPAPLTVVTLADRAGSGGARNAGVEVARAPLLAFCDADDVVAPGWLAALVEATGRHPLVGGRLDHDTLNDPRRTGRRPTLAAEELPVTLGRWRYALGANMGAQRDLLIEVGGFRPGPQGGTDADLCVRAQVEAGVAPIWAGDAVVAYRHRRGWTALVGQHVRWGRAAHRLRRDLTQRHGSQLLRRTTPDPVADRRPAHALAGAAYAAGWVLEAGALSRRRTMPTGRP